MKKIYTLLFSTIIVLSGFEAGATIHSVTVNSSSFSPNALTVTVGDTIRWMHTGGSHTTTSTSVPATAATWDSPISSNVPSFDYIVMVAGTYNYKCTPHGFIGQFVALSSSGISTTPKTQLNFMVSSAANSVFTFSFSLSNSSMVNMTLTDMTGKLVRVLASGVKTGGDYSENYYLSDLRSGIYIVQFSSENQRITRRIVIE